MHLLNLAVFRGKRKVCFAAQEPSQDDMKHLSIEEIIEMRMKARNTCRICSKNFGQQARRHLPCGHTFHEMCIREEWIATKQMMVQCPVCQASYHLKELRNVDQVRYPAQKIECVKQQGED
eukprot:symbB.v1.2.008836.t1/scaffold556.1/size187764/7